MQTVKNWPKYKKLKLDFIMGKSERVLLANDSFCYSCSEKEKQQIRFEVVLWPLETVYGRKYSS